MIHSLNVRVRGVLRKTLYALLGVGPLVVVLDQAGASDMVLFIVAAAALIPLAWLIGEATEHAAHHTGPGIGGFLNATFGNAPELIIALFAVSDGLTEVVRGSLSGSVVGNLLLVLGFSLAFGGRGAIDRESSLTSAGLVVVAAEGGEPCLPAGLHERLVPLEVEEGVAPVEEHCIDHGWISE